MAAGTRLHRLHSRNYAPTQFNPGRGISRFAPIRDRAGNMIPTLYAGSSFECATFESVLHDVDFAAPHKTVPDTRLDNLLHSVLLPQRSLKLVQLFQPDLGRWKLQRSQLIDTMPAEYASTAKWAEAIHAAHPEADGMVWTSRRCDPEIALLFFGDRVSHSDFAIESEIEIKMSDEELTSIISFARRADITFTK